MNNVSLIRALASMGVEIVPNGPRAWSGYGKELMISWYVKKGKVEWLHTRKWEDIRADKYHHDPKFYKSIAELIATLNMGK